MNIFLYGIIGLLFYTYTLNLKRQELISSESSGGNRNIYYDKASELEELENDDVFVCCCRFRRKKRSETRVANTDEKD